MASHALLQLGSIFVAALLAHWIAWVLNIPSILLLLLAGLLIGPVFQLLQPDWLFGPALFPFVSLAVGVILFEGGLSLRLHEIRKTSPVVLRMISIGALVTWTGATLAALWCLGLSLKLSLLLGAILIVTGPTVITPLLRQVRPNEKVASLLRWEGILTDPLGAIIAFIVFEAILSGQFDSALPEIFFGVLFSLLTGFGFGILFGYLSLTLFRKFLIPDHLQGTGSLALVIACYLASDLVYPESGLLSCTLMGVILGNQHKVSIKQVADFKQHLQVLLISLLFIVLAARIPAQAVEVISFHTLMFLLALILIVRPLSVFCSTLGSRELQWQEAGFLSCVAPRGIVAAAVASVFSLKLVDAGFKEAEILTSVTFFCIVGTAFIYGLAAAPVAEALGVRKKHGSGIIIVGGGKLARLLAALLTELGVKVLFLVNSKREQTLANHSGLNAHKGDILSEKFLDSLDISGVKYVLTIGESDELNSLAALRFAEFFPSSSIFQLAPATDDHTATKELTGRYLASSTLTLEAFEDHLRDKESLRVITGNEIQEKTLPLFLLRDNTLYVMSEDSHSPIEAQDTVIILERGVTPPP